MKKKQVKIYNTVNRLVKEFGGRVSMAKAASHLNPEELNAIFDAKADGIIDFSDAGMISVKFSYLLECMRAEHSEGEVYL